MRIPIQTYQLLQDGGAPEYMYHDGTAWRCVFFVGKKYGSKEFYTAGFQGLVKRWNKCLNLYGDYVEN
jgi:hypothetical protein